MAKHCEQGMTTAEYSVGCVATAGFASVLCLFRGFFEPMIRSVLQQLFHLPDLLGPLVGLP
jgi:hypothetical protein